MPGVVASASSVYSYVPSHLCWIRQTQNRGSEDLFNHSTAEWAQANIRGETECSLKRVGRSVPKNQSHGFVDVLAAYVHVAPR